MSSRADRIAAELLEARGDGKRLEFIAKTVFRGLADLRAKLREAEVRVEDLDRAKAEKVIRGLAKVSADLHTDVLAPLGIE